MSTVLVEPATTRDGQGRFVPGRSGNPAGRKPGSRNQATRLREILADPDIERAIEVLRAQLRDGKGVAARFVLERLFPKPRDREIDLGLEDGATVAEMFDRILRLMAAGEITIDEASRMARLIEARRQHGEPRPAPVESAGADAACPASDLQTAGIVEPLNRPLNRHARRRAAALARGLAAERGWNPADGSSSA